MTTPAVDFPILGPPSISLATFQRVLATAHSPATGEAAGIYAAFVAQGVDPAIGLAIAQHESSFGKSGIAVGRNNLYGNRYYASQAALGGRNVGGWGAFPSYTAGARYEAGLLAGALYGRSGKYATARTFPFRYAPARDHNAPGNYGAAVVRSILLWRGGSGGAPLSASAAQMIAGSGKATKATHHPSAKAPAVAHAHSTLAEYVHAHPRTATAAGAAGAAGLALLIL